MNVSLTPELEEFISAKVHSGRYNSASEVVREALRLLEGHDQARVARHDRSVESPGRLGKRQPLAARIRELWTDVPDTVRAKLPVDGASEHDHYIYGVPKRKE